MSNQIKTVIFDSSVWVSSLLPEDVNHRQAIAIVKSYNNEKYTILVPEIVFYEVIIVLVRKDKYNLALNFVDLKFKFTHLDKEDFLNLVAQYKDHLKTKTQDSLIIMHCLRYNAEYFETFDNQQRNTYNLIKSL